LEKARETYRTVTGELGKIAAGRADLLEKMPVKEFYDWFAKAELPAASVLGPGEPGARPFDLFQDVQPGADFLPPSGAGSTSLGPSLDGPSLEPATGASAPITPAAPAAPQSQAPSRSPTDGETSPAPAPPAAPDTPAAPSSPAPVAPNPPAN
jgi:hypothetical protein